jgi:AcrR family transcriptional regulator
VVKVKAKRRYDSALRKEQAGQTRTRILDSAQKLFQARGYAATTMEAVAGEAGVATDTVYANFRSKTGLLRSLIGVRVAGDESAVRFMDRPGPQSVRTQPTQRAQLQAFAADIAATLERARPVDEIIRGAGAVDPEVAAMRAQMQQIRHARLSELVDWLAEKGPFRGGMDRDEAADIVWALASPEVNGLLRRDRGWSQDRYVAWLADALTRTLLQDRGARKSSATIDRA